jgi:xylulokinase
MGAALGLGLRAGQVAVSLGTSGTTYAVSERRTADPSGIVAGFADATGRFLPLAATLNCTLAVDRVAALFGLDRDDVAPSGEVVALPWFDGERTPNVPNASGTIVGLRHDTRPQQVLMAAYEGASASLLDAVDAIAAQTGGLDPAAPLVLIGGGAKGRTWVDVVRRLSGRPVLIPDAQELVAIGAAVQAAAILGGEDPGVVAARWGTNRGTLHDAVPRDDERLARIAALRAAVVETPALAGTGR